MSTFARAAVVVNPNKECQSLLQGIQERCATLGVEVEVVLLPEEHASPLPARSVFDNNVDFVISLGGDGTLLFTARFFYGLPVPVLAVNLGTFGFMTEISRDEVYEAINSLCAGDFQVQERMMLDVRVVRDGEIIDRFFPLNEAVVGRRAFTRLITIETKVNGRYLCTYRADGLIVSSPTGSTAYSLSANGPIMMPGLNNIIVNPICPHSLATRPFILSGNDLVEVVVDGHDIQPALSIDVQEGMALQRGDVVQVRKAEFSLQLVLSKQRTFFQVLREKLGWFNS